MARAIGLAAVGASLLVLAGCSSLPEITAPAAAPPSPAGAARPSPYPVEKLVGAWGMSSYRQDKDRKRTEAMARVQCKLPYVIKKGPTDGVMMHVADDAKLYELTLKGSASGKTYLGFNSPPGDPADREILSFSDNLIVMKFVDPDADNRYGKVIYVRCGANG